MTPLERKVIRRAGEMIAREKYPYTSVSAVKCAGLQLDMYWSEIGHLTRSFRIFYDEAGCPFCEYKGDWEELKTIRILLLETFLIFDGELK